MSREVKARVEERTPKGYAIISVQPHLAGDLQPGEIITVVIPEGEKRYDPSPAHE